MSAPWSPLAIWGLWLAMAALTLALRASFVVLQDRVRIPDLLRRGLAYVPAAVLAAIVAPAVVHVAPGEALDLAVQAPRWAAAAVGMLVAVTTRSMPLVLALGMATLWLVRAWMG